MGFLKKKKTFRTFKPQQSTVKPFQSSDVAQEQSAAATAASDPPTQPAWNPFDDDNFSNLSTEKLKTDNKDSSGKAEFHASCRCMKKENRKGLHCAHKPENEELLVSF